MRRYIYVICLPKVLLCGSDTSGILNIQFYVCMNHKNLILKCSQTFVATVYVPIRVYIHVYSDH